MDEDDFAEGCGCLIFLLFLGFGLYFLFLYKEASRYYPSRTYSITVNNANVTCNFGVRLQCGYSLRECVDGNTYECTSNVVIK